MGGQVHAGCPGLSAARCRLTGPVGRVGGRACKCRPGDGQGGPWTVFSGGLQGLLPGKVIRGNKMGVQEGRRDLGGEGAYTGPEGLTWPLRPKSCEEPWARDPGTCLPTWKSQRPGLAQSQQGGRGDACPPGGLPKEGPLSRQGQGCMSCAPSTPGSLR